MYFNSVSDNKNQIVYDITEGRTKLENDSQARLYFVTFLFSTFFVFKS